MEVRRAGSHRPRATRTDAAEEKAREIERLKTEARADLHAAEAKFSDGSAKADPKAMPWWEGPKPSGRLQGSLKQVDCLGKQARLVVEDSEHKIVKLLVARGDLKLNIEMNLNRR